MAARTLIFSAASAAHRRVGASAHRVIAVTPWFGYSRQDKKSAPREPISSRLLARIDLYTAAGVFSGRLPITLGLDVHTKDTAPVTRCDASWVLISSDTWATETPSNAGDICRSTRRTPG